MELKTKFSIGSTVYTVNNCKVVDFVVEAIVITEDGVRYCNSKVVVMDGTPEEYCFPSKEALIAHLSKEE